VDAATERLRAETTVPGLLSTAAQSFMEVLNAQACTISRVIGDLLVDLLQQSREGRPQRLGHGYLISDYPLTRAAIDEGSPYTVFLDDPNADRAEAELLRELGFDSLLMCALEAKGEAWGLVEVYDKGRRFSDQDVAVAHTLAVEVGTALERLERPAQ
jgi:GAF domain-containing protein